MTNPLRVLCDVAATLLLVVALLLVYYLDARAPTVTPSQIDRPVLVNEDKSTKKVVTQPLHIGVTPAHFDDMGKLLDTLGEGYRYVMVRFEELLDANRLAALDVLFLTCAEPDKLPPGLSDRLREFVRHGGTLYVSDLLFQVVAEAFPEMIDQTKVAQGRAQDLTARVVDTGLQDVIGPELGLRFDLDGWRPAAFSTADAVVYLEGTFRTTAGVELTAPLLARMPFENGTIVFTSFHNEKQNSETELELLRHLVFTTVTAQLESTVRETMVTGGFSPSKENLLSASTEARTVTQTYVNREPGRLQFVLAFAKQGARLEMQVRSPSGELHEREGDSTFSIEVPEADAGEWSYRVTAREVPYENFPFTLTVGAESKGNLVDTRRRNDVRLSTRDRVTAEREPRMEIEFREVALEETQPKQAMRLAVTEPVYDDMGKLLRTLGEGYNFASVTEVELSKPARLSEYDVLFLTCGGTGGGSAVPSSLRSFVEAGGTLYASDLRYDVVAAAFPEFVEGENEPTSLYEELQAEAVQKALNDAGLPSVELDVETVEQALTQVDLGPDAAANVPAIAQALEATGNADTPRLRPAEITETLEQAGIAGVTAADVAKISDALRKRGLTINRKKAKLRRQQRKQKRSDAQAVAQRAMEQFARMWASANANGAPTGAAQQLDADVVSPDLRELLGPTMRLTFDMGGWKPAAFRNKAVTTFLRGRYRTGSGQESEAPFLVRFPVDDGTVIFTSFHNAKQNDEDELKLLRFLVFAAVTAEAETLLTKTMVAGGFSPVKKNIHSHSSGSPSVTQVYRNKKAGRLQFAIGLPNDGARLKMTIVAPNGQIYEKQFESTFIVEVPNAPIGDWRYTVAAEDVPFPNFPFTVSIGEE